MAEKKTKGFHALEKKIHELEDEDRATRRSARDEGEAELIEIDEREKAAAIAPPSHEE
jgi:hypothetical protein